MSFHTLRDNFNDTRKPKATSLVVINNVLQSGWPEVQNLSDRNENTYWDMYWIDPIVIKSEILQNLKFEK